MNKGVPAGFRLERPHAPFFPNACIRVEPVSESVATHTINLREDQRSGFRHWALVERATGNELVALATNDATSSSLGRQTSDARELKRVRFGKVNCRDPYFSMLNTLHGSQVSTPERLSLQRRTVMSKSVIDPEEAANWPQLKAHEENVDSESKADEHRPGDKGENDWERAFQAARSSGWADYEGDLIDYRAGELISLPNVKLGANWLKNVTKAASRHGFVFVSPMRRGGKQDLLLLRFSLDGSLQWQGHVRPMAEHAGLTDFDPLDVNWRNGEIRILGFRRTAAHDTQRWMFTIPESAIGVVN